MTINESRSVHIRHLLIENDISMEPVDNWHLSRSLVVPTRRVYIPFPITSQVEFFVALHEIGHVVHGHMWTIWTEPEQMFYDEIEADRWAYNNMPEIPKVRTLESAAKALYSYRPDENVTQKYCWDLIVGIEEFDCTPNTL